MLLIGVGGAALTWSQAFGLDLPPWVPWAISLIALVVAQFLALHTIRAVRDSAVQANDTTDLAEFSGLLSQIDASGSNGRKLHNEYRLHSIGIHRDEYLTRKRRVSNWINDVYQTLSARPDWAARFGDTSEIMSMENYDHVTTGNVAIDPLGDYLASRLERLELLRRASS